mgnify:CR=1 FL=1
MERMRRKRRVIFILLFLLIINIPQIYIFYLKSKFKEWERQEYESLASSGVVEEAPGYNDGEYIGSSKGKRGPVRIRITIAGGRINDIEALEHSASNKYLWPPAYKALISIPQRIIRRQTIKGIDAVSGATVTSKDLLLAVENAINMSKER